MHLSLRPHATAGILALHPTLCFGPRANAQAVKSGCVRAYTADNPSLQAASNETLPFRQWSGDHIFGISIVTKITAGLNEN